LELERGREVITLGLSISSGAVLTPLKRLTKARKPMAFVATDELQR
jgi:hypothetical protein